MSLRFFRSRRVFRHRNPLRLVNLESRVTPSAALPELDLSLGRVMGPINRPAIKDMLDGGEVFQGADRAMQLVRRMDELVVRVDRAGWQPSGELSGFTIERALNATTLVLRAPASSSFSPDDARLSAMANVSGVEWTGPVYTEPERPEAWMVASDEIVVRLDEGVDAARFFASEPIAQSYRPLWGTPDTFVVTIAGGGGLRAFAASEMMVGEAGVSWSEPNLIQSWHTMSTPNDPLYPNQWHLENSGASGGKVDADVDASAAWDLTTGDPNVVVAVIDDSVQIAHPDLAPNIFVNPGEIAGNSIDDDGNGWIDDVNGYDFGHDSANYDNDPSPTVADDNHGTNVAGVIAAKGDNSLGVAGVAYNVKILPVRIGLGGTYTSDSDIAAAIYYASGRTKDGLGTWNAAQITNNSWGGGGLSQALTDAFTWSSNTARGGKGVLNFCAAGNGGGAAVTSPSVLAGSLSGVMSIGASTNLDVRSSYSQYGPELDLTAPSNGGTLGIQTTDRTGTDGYTSTDYNSGFGGTSSATPLSAGIGALVLSRDLNMTAAQIRGLLHNTTDLIGPLAYDATGKNLQYGYGRINAATAVRGVGISEIQVLQSASDVPDGSEVKFASYLNQPQDLVIRVRNQGTVDLNLGSINIAAGPFTLLQGFGDSTLSVGESTSMTVRYVPTTPGIESRALSFTNSDSDEGTFDITLTGTGLAKSVSGTVFEDFDGDNVLDAGEPGLAGRQVYLDLNNNGVLDTVTTTFNSTDVPKTLPDVATTASTISISGLSSIADINVKLSLTHSYDGDLIGTLISPSGTKVQLFSHVGSSGDNFANTVFDDEGTTAIASGTAPYSAGPYIPASALSAFDGQSPNGVWTLEIVDSYSSDTGTLTAWSIVATTASTGELATTTAADGSYHFDNLSPGNFTVRASSVAGWTTAPGQPVTINTVNDQISGRNFGSSRANAIYGQTHISLDGNGVANTGEAALPNRMVYVDSNANGVLDTSSVTLSATDLPKAINDFSTTTSTIAASGLGVVTDIDIKMTLTHTYDADLTGYLVGPTGAKVLLFANVGGAGQGFTDTVFDDEAVATIGSGTAPFTGSYKPQALLSAFDGLTANGNWSLQITDGYSQDTGNLTAWSITINYATEQFTSSSNDGWYSFTNLAPGSYPLRVNSEVGYDFVPAGGAQTVTLNAGETALHRDFGRFVPGTTYGRLFNDVNGNGVDDTEAGLAGWTVYNDLNNNGSFETSLVTNYPSSNVPMAIPDTTTVTSTISLSTAATSISDLNVKLNITHSYDFDLKVTLISPAGTRVELTSGNGSSGDNYTDTVFDDAAAGSVTAGTAPFTGSYKPEQVLSVLNGTNPNGVWTLEVADTATSDSGTLNSWSLAVTTSEPVATTDANGYYQFANLPAGAINLRRVLQSGYVSTSPVGGVQSFTHVNGVADFGKDFGARIPPAPTVTGVTFGDGTNQRSTVRQMVVNFSEAVNFSGSVASAFTLHRTGTGGTIGDVTLTANPATGPASSVTITFSGGLTESNNSLVDGLYDFTIDASKVSGVSGALDGDGVGGAGGNYFVAGTTANQHYRLFGDDNGDGTVNQSDYDAFRLAFLSGPSTKFDFDNDGQVSQPDFNAFRLRYLGSP